MSDVLTYETLLAENAAMRGVIDAAVAVSCNSSGIAGWHLNGDIAGWDEILPELNIESPATAAALAAIEARGVEKFVTKIAERLRTAGGEDGYSLVHWGEYADHLEDKGEEFAAELREAK